MRPSLNQATIETIQAIKGSIWKQNAVYGCTLAPRINIYNGNLGSNGVEK